MTDSKATIFLHFLGRGNVIAQLPFRITKEEFEKFEKYNVAHPFEKANIYYRPDITNPTKPENVYAVVVSTPIPNGADANMIRKMCEKNVLLFQKTYKKKFFTE